MQPFISIVCPTKDRPECVQVLLKSLKNQTSKDFEIIISDNADKFPCKSIVDEAVNADMDVKYFRTPKCFGICDSFEYAISHATGKYAMVVEDKSILYPDAVEKINSVLKKEDLDILNFPWDFLTPYRKEEDIVSGILTYALRSGKVESVNVEYAMEEKFSCQKMFLDIDKEWNYGAIQGGVFSERFIKKIRCINENCRFFDGMVPDRCLSVEALCIVDKKKIKFLDDHITIHSANGRNTLKDDKLKHEENVLRYSREGKNYYDSMIFPGIASVHNALASDFMRIAERVKSCGQYKREKEYSIPKGRLLAIIEKRLGVFKFDSEEYKKELKLIEKYKTELSKEEYVQYEEKWIQMNRGRLICPIYRKEYIFPIKGFETLY